MICVDPKNDWCYADDSKVMIMHVIFTFKNLLHISTPQGYWILVNHKTLLIYIYYIQSTIWAGDPYSHSFFDIVAQNKYILVGKYCYGNSEGNYYCQVKL